MFAGRSLGRHLLEHGLVVGPPHADARKPVREPPFHLVKRLFEPKILKADVLENNVVGLGRRQKRSRGRAQQTGRACGVDNKRASGVGVTALLYLGLGRKRGTV